jgi:hypothetical protein
MLHSPPNNTNISENENGAYNDDVLGKIKIYFEYNCIQNNDVCFPKYEDLSNAIGLYPIFDSLQVTDEDTKVSIPVSFYNYDDSESRYVYSRALSSVASPIYNLMENGQIILNNNYATNIKAMSFNSNYRIYEIFTRKIGKKKLIQLRVGGKLKVKGKSNKNSKKPVASQKTQNQYKEILGKRMKIYKMPDSRKEYVKYKGELYHITDYKNIIKQITKAKNKK